MGRKDPRFDAYIAKTRPFAKPILEHLGAVVHEFCPKVEEDMKCADLAAALRRKRKALAAFDAFGSSAKREYIEWITEARAIEWMAEGKPRNWKYMKEWKAAK